MLFQSNQESTETNIPKPIDSVASYDENVVTELLAQNLTFSTELKSEC